MNWSVLLEMSAPKNAASADPDDERFDRLLDLLAPYGAVVGVSQDGQGFSVRLTIDCHAGLRDVLEQAIGVVDPARRKVKLPAWPMTRGEIVRADELASEVAERNFPDVVGTTEVTAFLGVSRQRLQNLRKLLSFPEPMVEIAAGPLWLRSAIEAFDAGWVRTPGRPAIGDLKALLDEELSIYPRANLYQNMFRSNYRNARAHGLGSHATIEPTAEAAYQMALDAVRKVAPDFEPEVLSPDAKQPPPAH